MIGLCGLTVDAMSGGRAQYLLRVCVLSGGAFLLSASACDNKTFTIERIETVEPNRVCTDAGNCFVPDLYGLEDTLAIGDCVRVKKLTAQGAVEDIQRTEC